MFCKRWREGRGENLKCTIPVRHIEGLYLNMLSWIINTSRDRSRYHFFLCWFRSRTHETYSYSYSHSFLMKTCSYSGNYFEVSIILVLILVLVIILMTHEKILIILSLVLMKKVLQAYYIKCSVYHKML